MALKGKVCNKGVWDETIPGIIFDNQGNYVSENSGVGTTRYDLAAASFGS